MLSKFALLTFLVQHAGSAKELIALMEQLIALRENGITKEDGEKACDIAIAIIQVVKPIIKDFPTSVFAANGESDCDELLDSLSASVGKERPILAKLIQFFLDNWQIILPLFLDEKPE